MLTLVDAPKKGASALTYDELRTLEYLAIHTSGADLVHVSEALYIKCHIAAGILWKLGREDLVTGGTRGWFLTPLGRLEVRKATK